MNTFIKHKQEVEKHFLYKLADVNLELFLSKIKDIYCKNNTAVNIKDLEWVTDGEEYLILYRYESDEDFEKRKKAQEEGESKERYSLYLKLHEEFGNVK